MNQGMKQFAPETAVGTGADNPLVDPLVQANAVPSIDKTGLTAEGANGNNKPRNGEDQIDVSGAPLAEPSDRRTSTGEDEETRTNPNAHARDTDANQVASTTRPAAPQNKRSNARPKGTPTSKGLPTQPELLTRPDDTTAPSVPADLASPAKTSTSVDLTWGVVGDASGYRLRDGGTDVAGAEDLQEPKFTHTGLTAGSAHSYTVSSRDKEGNRSAESTALAVTTDA